MAWVEFRDTGYKVSDDGYIMNPKGRILRNQNRGNGYKYVNIKGKTYSVHRLVAECFIQNPNGLSFVNHKDGNKQNNVVSNLEWCNRSYNQQHAYINGLQTAKKSWNNSLSKAVEMFTRNGNFVRRFGSLADAVRFLRKPLCAYTCITRCCNGERKTAFNFVWKWFNQETYRQRFNLGR